jgi:hypothetical protein
MRTSNTITLFLLLSTSISAFAAADTILDPDGMPVCVVDNSKKTFVKFLWNKDIYTRPILAASHTISEKSGKGSETSEAFNKEVVDECKRSFIKMNSPEMVTSPIVVDNVSYEILSPTATAYDDVKFDADVLEKLNQVRLGGNVYRPLEIRTADLYAKKNNLTAYDKNMNRDLSKKYGAGFSGDVYFEVLQSNPDNKALHDQTVEYVKKALTKKSIDKELNARFKDITFVIVKGFAHDRDNDERISPLSRVLKEFGFKILEFKTNPYGRTLGESQVIAEQLEEALKAGKQMIITSGSAATSQAMGALAQLNVKYDGKISTALPGKVIAYMNLSGVVSGAFAPEAISSNPLLWAVIKGKMKGLIFGDKEELEKMKAASVSLTGDKKALANLEIERYERRLAYADQKGAIESFRDLSTKQIEKFMKPVFPLLPNDVIYYNLIGINKKNGIVKDPKLNYLQTKYVRAKFSGFFKKIGANDGFIEYPGTQLTTDMVQDGRIFSIVFDAGHPILDGNFDKFPLNNNEPNRKAVIGSVLMTLADKLGI